MGYERKILISCEYEASREQIRAISKIGAAYEQTPPELLSAAFLTVASGHLDQLNIFDTSEMKKTLEA